MKRPKSFFIIDANGAGARPLRVNPDGHFVGGVEFVVLIAKSAGLAQRLEQRLSKAETVVRLHLPRSKHASAWA
jgi:hypothetical protein